MSVDIAWLGNQILGRNLNEKESTLLATIISEKTYASGETIISTGQEGGVLHMMRSGSANIEVLKDGEKPLKVAEVEAGELFGELTFLNNNPATADVVATQDCVVYKLPREQLVSVIDEGEEQLAYLFFSSIVERQTSVIHEQRVTLAPELRKLNNKAVPTFAKVGIVAALIVIVLIIASS
ncbi:cyclic nucleotide-binding domain-containing protein [Mariprofundus sp. NF]|uniref:cyclic nucleotide-binding domain-containing protein n=1 Tax=Mariprofundus sp. NF TaxID=2608716 RepID=UPI00159F7D47|nr:cyclic nucleotide-binding domain-containing protein [Mariprofundus sp. NF]NWF39004.1 cyclic nucleotide-binding domain-containing protein [Mariprofundus sp. NF]